jgi:Mor family transcriptional regulator
MMKYLNAADVLPKQLLKELSVYASGQLLYVPSIEDKKPWGSKSGSKQYYEKRNREIVELYQNGLCIDEIRKRFNLSYDTIRRIIKVNSGR